MGCTLGVIQGGINQAQQQTVTPGVTKINMWEGACSRWLWVSRHIHRQTLCHREQAPSHILSNGV
ncbi:hypothetical protein C4J90_5014 [Pseudomonas sp. R2-60-08W]|nr:hypothetical protein C4J90_5014 [Pseudomonas sp. R2-60-08W]